MPYPCPLCGTNLYETGEVASCTFCGEREETEYLCPEGHYVCEGCQMAGPVEVIERVCSGTQKRDPAAIANLIMKHPACVTHGPLHHAMVAPVVLAALANLGLRELREGEIAGAIRRTVEVPAAVCASRGTCGAAQSAGALVSLLTGANYLKDRERSLALETTAATLLAIAGGGGPRCCKQSVYLALETLAGVLQREWGMELPLAIRCEFVTQNVECKGARCAYYEAPE